MLSYKSINAHSRLENIYYDEYKLLFEIKKRKHARHLLISFEPMDGGQV